MATKNQIEQRLEKLERKLTNPQAVEVSATSTKSQLLDRIADLEQELSDADERVGELESVLGTVAEQAKEALPEESENDRGER